MCSSWAALVVIVLILALEAAPDFSHCSDEFSCCLTLLRPSPHSPRSLRPTIVACFRIKCV